MEAVERSEGSGEVIGAEADGAGDATRDGRLVRNGIARGERRRTGSHGSGHGCEGAQMMIMMMMKRMMLMRTMLMMMMMMMMMIMMIIMRVDRQVKANVFFAPSVVALPHVSGQHCNLEPSWNYMSAL